MSFPSDWSAYPPPSLPFCRALNLSATPFASRGKLAKSGCKVQMFVIFARGSISHARWPIYGVLVFLISDIFGNIVNGILIFSVIWYIWKYGREFFGNQCCTSGRALFLDRSHRCQGLLWTSLNFFDYQHWLIIIDYFWVPLSIIDYLLFSVIDHTNAKDFLSPVFQQKCWTLEIIFFLP